MCLSNGKWLLVPTGKMSDQWFVHSNGEQMGPYTGEQLVQYAQQGNITAETMVWAEGMPEWVPAAQIPGLFSQTPVAAAPAAAAVTTTSTAWAPPGSRLAAGGAKVGTVVASSAYRAQAPVGGEYPFIPVKQANFGLWIGTFLGGFVLTIIGIVLIIPAILMAAAATAAASTGAASGGEVAGAASLSIGFILALIIGIITSMFSAILFYIYLYRAWTCLQAGAPRTTPGKAVGFLFIPFFNIYWFFVAINGLPKDWNRVVSSYEDLKTAPRLNETTFLLFCIGIFIAPLALVMMFPMMSQLCKGINFFAARRNPSAPTSAFSAFGRR